MHVVQLIIFVFFSLDYIVVTFELELCFIDASLCGCSRMSIFLACSVLDLKPSTAILIYSN